MASVICGGRSTELTEVPYFWSDLFDVKIQALGYLDPIHETRRLEVKGRTALLYVSDNTVRGILGFSAARAVMKMRTLIASGATADDAEELLRA